jgi:hypothetical protein
VAVDRASRVLDEFLLASAAKAAEASAAPAKTEPAAPPPASSEAKPDSAK